MSVAVPRVGSSAFEARRTVRIAGLGDRIAIQGFLAARPDVRARIRRTVNEATGGRLTSAQLSLIERQLLKHIKVKEALMLPNRAPAAGRPVILTRAQMSILIAAAGRFDDQVARTLAMNSMKAAVAAGKVIVR